MNKMDADQEDGAIRYHHLIQNEFILSYLCKSCSSVVEFLPKYESFWAISPRGWDPASRANLPD